MMTRQSIATMRPVYVIGIGLHPYQFPGSTPFVALGLTAVRQALADGRLQWRDVESAYLGNVSLGMAGARVMTRHLGSTGLSIQSVENASASGSTAFRLACIDVAAGLSDVSLAFGVDKTGPHVQRALTRDGVPRFSEIAELMVVKFALLAQSYMRRTGATPADLAAVAVKNHGNAALNINAQFRKARSLEQVMAATKVVGELTVPQCCPRGDGAAAALVVSDEAIKRYDLDRSRAIAVRASSSVSDLPFDDEMDSAVDITRRAAQEAFDQAGLGPRDVDVVELHEAFTVEELIYLEAMGFCKDGEAASFVSSGQAAIGGNLAVNASGGLLGMGHPIGPTGIGQIAEIVRQLRGEAGNRQHVGARTGLAHMIGLGQVGLVHILQKG